MTTLGDLARSKYLQLRSEQSAQELSDPTEQSRVWDAVALAVAERVRSMCVLEVALAEGRLAAYSAIKAMELK